MQISQQFVNLRCVTKCQFSYTFKYSFNKLQWICPALTTLAIKLVNKSLGGHIRNDFYYYFTRRARFPE